MRSDYALYAVSVIFFIITALVLAINTLADFERNLSAISTVILGLLFVALGYSQRPRLKTSLMIRPTPQPPATTAPQVTLSPVPTVQETVTPQPTEAVAPIKTKLELTQVKGIKEKRAEQLRALGIKSVEDLANASAAELAAKLKIASYFTEKWIENAKELAGKS